jgi:hypothetical protein
LYDIGLGELVKKFSGNARVRERVERIILKFVSLFKQRYYRIRYTFA